jgi:ABC-type amino acid transport substrate-binding protein
VESIVERVLQRGHLVAGVSRGIIGLSWHDALSDRWCGFDADLARAIAAAVLGDAEAVEFVSVSPEDRFTAVAGGAIDVGTFNASATLGREAVNGVVFAQAMLYDGEALMVRAADIRDHANAIESVEHRVIAIQRGATTKENLERYFARRALKYSIVEFVTPAEALAAYASGACNFYALDRIPLTGERLRLDNPDAHVILDEQLSKELMGPVVSMKDVRWRRSIEWIMRALIEAEELGIASVDCERMHEAGSRHVRDFLGLDAEKSSTLDLKPHFPMRVVRQVGNYAEIFARNLGDESH